MAERAREDVSVWMPVGVQFDWSVKMNIPVKSFIFLVFESLFIVFVCKTSSSAHQVSNVQEKSDDRLPLFNYNFLCS